MQLPGRDPQVVQPGKPKVLIYGAPGTGKSFFATGFPRPFYIDTEDGAEQEKYQERLIANKGRYYNQADGAGDMDSILTLVKLLMSSEHEYRTLVYDSFSHSYALQDAINESKVGIEFGRSKKMTNIPTRQLIRWLEKLDMSVLWLCHSQEKEKHEGEKKTTYTQPVGIEQKGFDFEHLFSLIGETVKVGVGKTAKYYLHIKKSRYKGFTDGDMVPLDYKSFAELYGKDIIEAKSVAKDSSEAEAEIQAETQALATDEQIIKIHGLVSGSEELEKTLDGWLRKAKVARLTELSVSQATNIIAAIEKKVSK